MSHNDYTVDSKIIACQSDKDCPYSSICYYFNASNLLVGQCGCSLENGDIGVKCNGQSTMTYTRIFLMSVATFVALLMSVYIIKELWKTHLDFGLKKLDVKITTLIGCLLYEIFIIIFNVGGILTLISHDPFPVIDGVTGKKMRQYYLVRNVGTAGFVLFLIAGLLNVSVLWLEIVISSRKFKKISNPQISKNYQKAILIFDLIFVTLTAVTIWYDTSLIGIVGSALIILICIVYVNLLFFLSVF